MGPSMLVAVRGRRQLAVITMTAVITLVVFGGLAWWLLAIGLQVAAQVAGVLALFGGLLAVIIPAVRAASRRSAGAATVPVRIPEQDRDSVAFLARTVPVALANTMLMRVSDAILSSDDGRSVARLPDVGDDDLAFLRVVAAGSGQP